MVTIFEDIFGSNQEDELKLEELVEGNDGWDSGLDESKPDTWNTGQVNDIWSVG